MNMYKKKTVNYTFHFLKNEYVYIKTLLNYMLFNFRTIKFRQK